MGNTRDFRFTKTFALVLDRADPVFGGHRGLFSLPGLNFWIEIKCFPDRTHYLYIIFAAVNSPNITQRRFGGQKRLTPFWVTSISDRFLKFRKSINDTASRDPLSHPWFDPITIRPNNSLTNDIWSFTLLLEFYRFHKSTLMKLQINHSNFFQPFYVYFNC